MNKEIKEWGEKFIVLLVVLLLIFPFDLPAKKKGARLKVYKKDGKIVLGELLQIKDKSLLLMTNSETGVTIDIKEVREIGIRRRGSFWKGFIPGSVGGLVIGGLSGAVVASIDEGSVFGGILIGGIFLGGITGIFFGVLSSVINAFSISKYKQFIIEGKSQEEIDSIMINLKKKARIK